MTRLLARIRHAAWHALDRLAGRIDPHPPRTPALSDDDLDAMIRHIGRRR